MEVRSYSGSEGRLQKVSLMNNRETGGTGEEEHYTIKQVRRRLVDFCYKVLTRLVVFILFS